VFGLHVSLQISLPDQDSIADDAVVAALVCRVQPLVLVEVTGIAEAAIANVALERLVAGMRADVNPQPVLPGVHVIAVHAPVTPLVWQLADVADDLLHFYGVHLAEARSLGRSRARRGIVSHHPSHIERSISRRA